MPLHNSQRLYTVILKREKMLDMKEQTDIQLISIVVIAVFFFLKIYYSQLVYL